MEILASQLINLSDMAFKNYPGMVCSTLLPFECHLIFFQFPSPYGCDEFIKLFLYKQTVSQEFIHELEVCISPHLHGELLNFHCREN